MSFLSAFVLLKIKVVVETGNEAKSAHDVDYSDS